MTKHYILTLNANAQYKWEQCSLHDPLTAKYPDFASLMAQAVGKQVLKNVPLEVATVTVTSPSELVA